VYLSEFVNQSLVNQLADELGDSWHTQLQFPGQFSNSIVTLVDKMGNEILFYLNVFRAFVAFKKVIFYHVFTDFDYKGFDISKKRSEYPYETYGILQSEAVYTAHVSN
jgi:hypothetical protein